MQYTIQNDKLCLVINSHGAELNSVRTPDGCEYLWQGDAKVWDEQAPNLFPYIARLTKDTYRYDGQEYHMMIHGFIHTSELIPCDISETSITFQYESNEASLKQYPFAFLYEITYTLEENHIKIEHKVYNRDQKRMFFGIGGHPGFRVPLEEGLDFSDYALVFEQETYPTRVGFTADCFLNGKDEHIQLTDNRKIPLRHNLFDQDAIVLKNTAHGVSICSDKGTKGVKVTFPDYPIVGFWHMPKMEVPYVCVEPWSSLPSRKDVIEDISQQSDLIALDAGKVYQNHWDIEII